MSQKSYESIKKQQFNFIGTPVNLILSLKRLFKSLKGQSKLKVGSFDCMVSVNCMIYRHGEPDK